MSIDIASFYRPNKMQARYHKSPADYVCLWGGADSGKSWGAYIENLLLSHDFSNNEGLVIRYSYRELKDTAVPKYMEFAQKMGIFIDFRASDMEMWVSTIDPNSKSIIKFRSIHEAGAKRTGQASKLGSTELGWWHLEEGQDPRIKEIIWQALIKRLRLAHIPFRRGTITCNPPTPDHWIYRIFWPLRELPDGIQRITNEDGSESTIQLITTTTTDNVDVETGEPYYDVKNLNQMLAHFSPAMRQVYIEGKPAFVPVGVPIWSNFDWNIHTGEFEPERGRKVIRIWDFGRRRACVIFLQLARVRNEKIYGLNQQRPPLDRITFLRELIFENKTTYRMAEEVKSYSSEEFANFVFDDVGDIAGKQKKAESELSSFDILKELGIRVRGRAVQGIREKCIELIEEKLGTVVQGTPIIQIDEKRCPVLVGALSGEWTRDEEGHPTEDNYYEHPGDCAIYTIANFFMNEHKASTPIIIKFPSYGQIKEKLTKVAIVR